MCTLTQIHVPPLLRQICPSDLVQTEEWVSSPSHCQKFYQAPLTKDKVHFVDTPEALQRCRNIVLKVCMLDVSLERINK